MAASSEDDDPQASAWALEMIARIEQGGRVGPEIAARRPSRRQLAASLRLWTGLLSARVSDERDRRSTHTTSEDLGPFDELSWHPSERSIAVADHELLVDAGWPEDFLRPTETADYDHVCLFVRRITEGLLDHLRALSSLLESDKVTRSLLVLARVLLDGAAHVSHLTELAIPAEDRLMRALNYELALRGAAYKDAHADGDNDRMQEYEQRVAVINRIVGPRLGFQVGWRNRPEGSPRLGNPRRGEIITNALEGSTSAFQTLSAAVHMQEDAGFRFMTGTTAWADPHGFSRVILFLLHGLTPVVQAQELTARYMGWDFSPAEAAAPDLLNRWAIAAGMADDQLRRQILAEWGETDLSATPPPSPPEAACPDE